MREIIFRGQKVDNGEWVYGFLCCANIIDDWTPHKWEDEEGNTGEYCTTERYKVIPETIGQFTGLTDKNGKKIFEGDIVATTRTFAHCNRIYEVRFSEARCGWFPFASGDGCGCCENEVECPEYVEIIGNIYDNKDLLEDKE